MELEVDQKPDRVNSSMFIEDQVNIFPSKKTKPKQTKQYILGAREKEMDLLLVPGLQLLTEHVTNSFYAL